MIVVIGIPDDPAFGEIGKMLLVEPYESIDERAPADGPSLKPFSPSQRVAVHRLIFCRFQLCL